MIGPARISGPGPDRNPGMRLLVIGGTWFLGRMFVEEAVRAGHDVTTFNRGRTADDVPGVATVRGDRTNPGDLGRLRAAGEWDAVIDTCGYVPADVLASATALDDRAGRYVFVSTIAAYAGWPVEPLTEDRPLRECAPTAVDAPDTDRGERYGRLKAGCERAVRDAFGDRTVILRPGVILGPYEYLGRLPWWLHRVARGGRVLAPGPPDRGIQPADVRDVAAFALRTATTGDAGTYNVTAPPGHTTYEELLTACAQATGSDAGFTWVDDGFLLDHGVEAWTELPLWRPAPGTWRVDSARARAHGLTSRAIGETVAGAWRWLASGGRAVDEQRPVEPGIDAAKEARLLAAWAARAHPA